MPRSSSPLSFFPPTVLLVLFSIGLDRRRPIQAFFLSGHASATPSDFTRPWPIPLPRTGDLLFYRNSPGRRRLAVRVRVFSQRVSLFRVMKVLAFGSGLTALVPPPPFLSWLPVSTPTVDVAMFLLLVSNAVVSGTPPFWDPPFVLPLQGPPGFAPP